MQPSSFFYSFPFCVNIIVFSYKLFQLITQSFLESLKFSAFNFSSIFDSSIKMEATASTNLEARNLFFRQLATSLQQCLMSRRNGTLSTTHLEYLPFSSNIQFVSLPHFSKYFSFNSNRCCCLFSSKLSYVSKAHR